MVVRMVRTRADEQRASGWRINLLYRTRKGLERDDLVCWNPFFIPGVHGYVLLVGLMLLGISSHDILNVRFDILRGAASDDLANDQRRSGSKDSEY